MLENWSLILNVLLLVCVIIAIVRMMKTRRENLAAANTKLATVTGNSVVSVHKKEPLASITDLAVSVDSFVVQSVNSSERLTPAFVDAHTNSFNLKTNEIADYTLGGEAQSSLMMFLRAKENRELKGYELLQTVLAVGLRFGEGGLFYRHQLPNGKGPILCSLAAATNSGVFDMQNIGAFSVRGLCLFMQISGHVVIDIERFKIMFATAKQLCEGLDAYLLDDKRKPFSDLSLQRYFKLLNATECPKLSELMNL